VLVGGLATFGLLGGAIGFAPSFEAVLALRVLQGTGAAAIFITTVTLIGDAFAGVRRTAVLGVNVAVLSAAAAIYPVVGGGLSTLGWNVPFFLYFLALPVAAFAALALEERSPSAPRGPEYLRDALGAVTTPAILALFGVTFLTEFLAFGVVFTALPFLLAPEASAVAIGLVLLLAEAVSALAASAAGRLARSLSTVMLIAVGFAGYGAGFLTAWLSPTLTVIAGAAALVGVGIGVLLPSVDAAVSDRVPPEYRAGAFSLRNSTTFLGRTTGPVTFVALAAGFGYPRLLLAAGVIAFAAAAVAALAARRS
jgi:MFS family permease